MKTRWCRRLLVFTGAVLLGIFPGCVEVWVLNLATPFLLNR